jgi:hypothetical protein
MTTKEKRAKNAQAVKRLRQRKRDKGHRAPATVCDFCGEALPARRPGQRGAYRKSHEECSALRSMVEWLPEKLGACLAGRSTDAGSKRVAKFMRSEVTSALNVALNGLKQRRSARKP